MKRISALVVFGLLATLCAPLIAQDTVKVGMNYPKTGPYSAQGADQWRAANLALEEINAAGGIMGKQVELVWRDSKSNKKLCKKNVGELIDKEGAKMVFGGSASSVAIGSGKVCQEKNVPFFGTLTYSTATTGKAGQRHLFRECYNAWAGAKVLADYMSKNYAGKKFFYITADYTWGHTTEACFRKYTNTEDRKKHKVMLTPFPGAKDKDFKKAISLAKIMKPDVLVLVLFGKDMERAVRQATAMGLKSKMQIIVPNLTLGMAEGGGPKVMEGVIGAVPWCWRVPEMVGSEKGKAFVKNYAAKHKRYPSTSGASAYTIMYEYKSAVERAKTFDTAEVIRALEGHEYALLKDKQVWRAFDHQSTQTVFAVRCKPSAQVKADPFKLDYFEVIAQMDGDKAFRTREEWNAVRKAAGKPTHLEALPGDKAMGN